MTAQELLTGSLMFFTAQVSSLSVLCLLGVAYDFLPQFVSFSLESISSLEVALGSPQAQLTARAIACARTPFASFTQLQQRLVRQWSLGHQPAAQTSWKKHKPSKAQGSCTVMLVEHLWHFNNNGKKFSYCTIERNPQKIICFFLLSQHFVG